MKGKLALIFIGGFFVLTTSGLGSDGGAKGGSLPSAPEASATYSQGDGARALWQSAGVFSSIFGSRRILHRQLVQH